MRRVLLIGGAGYLGSVLCKKLLSRGYIVRVLDNLLYGDEGIKDFYGEPNFEFMNGDIRNIQDIASSMKDVDSVIHLAAIVGDPASNLNPEDTVDINYLATKNIIWACIKYNIKRYIFASTCSVYGGSEDTLLDETAETAPLSLYAEVKLKSEKEIFDNNGPSFHPTILRMATLYGISPRMRFDLVVNFFTISAFRNKKISLYGGNQKRCFCHVDDAAEAYIKCIESPIDKVSGRIFNVSSENMTIKELANRIKKYIGELKIKTYKKNIDDRSYITSSEKIKEATLWRPNKNIEDFINELECNINNNRWSNYEDPIYNNFKYLKVMGLRSI